MAPPTKRRKRNVVHASDDEEDAKPQTNTLANYLFSSPDQKPNSTATTSRAGSTSPSPIAKRALRPSNLNDRRQPPKKPTQSKATLPRKSERASSSTSPRKTRNQSAAIGRLEANGKTADLKTLFSRQAERTTTTPSSLVTDDISSDPISDEDGVSEAVATAPSRVAANARKRFRDGSQGEPGHVIGAAITASQKFLRPPRPTTPIPPVDDQRPWSERFGPLNLEELAVHKKKVADVRRWLEDVTAGRMRQRLLILKGAAGTGKTTTMRLLAKDMKCELLEWRNPAVSGTGLGFQSASSQFEEFMGRSGKFGQLETDLDLPTATSISSTKTKNDSRKIILIEEFPNTFTKSSTALQSFRGTVLQYLAANTPSLAAFGQPSPKAPITPIVMVISETLLTTTSASADSFTAHRLLGPEITRHPGTAIIEFNAIATTLLAGALDLIVKKEARKSGRKRTPGPLVLKRLGEIGDIRSAISSLEFLCLKGDDDADWGSRVAFAKPKRGGKDYVALTKGEQDSLELVTQRESSLGIFHAVGKVVYNKRAEKPMPPQSAEGKAEMLPGFLTSSARPKRSEVVVDHLMDETGTDTHTFISALHENYVLSCAPTGPSDQSSAVDYINECIEYLSESDLLCPTNDMFFGGRGFGSGAFAGRDSASHILRQEEITYQVATRGLLFSLPDPVKRIGTTSSRKGGEAFKMFYPTSLKLWREKEELGSMVDLWSTKLLRGEESASQHSITAGASAFRRPKNSTHPGGEWANKQHTSRSNTGQSNAATEQTQDQAAAPLLSLGSSARKELLLERLPYMAHIARSRRTSLDILRLRELEKVVSFSGTHGTPDEEAADVDDGNTADTESWATDKPTEESSPRKRTLAIRHKGGDPMAGPTVQKLVLSDDDIEDD
ncbi:cell cycle checkpoint protein RAD17 [Apiospora kogelbergensis]|uniref:Cell cycle checkpoint protein RAD17 n=1 Tax=Apiospora kogelbergensis TaxID=1337665 RepID=A0AAW0QVW9_9PEZI